MKKDVTLTIGLVYSKEPLTQLIRCLENLEIQIQNLPKEVKVKKLIVCSSRRENDPKDLKNLLNWQIIYSYTNNLAQNRNLILENANSDYLYITDPDCYGDPQNLKVLLAALHSSNKYNTKLHATAGGNKLISQNQKLNETYQALANMRWLNGGLAQIQIAKEKKFDWHAPTCNILYDFHVIKNQKFNLKFNRVGEDLEFHFRLSQNNFKIQICPEAFVWHESSSSFWSFLIKIFEYGQAQTTLLREHKKSISNRRLLVVGAIFLYLFIGVLVSSQHWLLIGLSLLATIIATLWFEFKGSPSRRFIRYVFDYGLVAAAYAFGQIFGLVHRSQQKTNA